jgi:hypothetical protein
MFRFSRVRKTEVAILDVGHAKLAQKQSVTNGISQVGNLNRKEKEVLQILRILRNILQLVEELRYKPEGCGFDSRWCHSNFSLI